MTNLHLIGNAHIDPVWLWRWQEGYAEIKATFLSVLDRMEEFEDFTFTSACADYYRLIEENAPEMFTQIQKRVKEGRWEIAGGWWIQPDCNLPSGESFARQGLYSQRYFQEKFGKIAKTGYNVDSFGHNGMLPQILKKSGMDHYVFTRPGHHEKDLVQDLFLWESPDESQVHAFRIPLAYNNSGKNIEKFQNRIDEVLKMATKQNIPFMFFYGVGNHGGGPTIATIQYLKQQKQKQPLVFSKVDEYFEYVKSLDLSLPVVKEDLQYHASGCYSAHSEIKKNNRRCENRLVKAEKFSAIAHRLCQLDYPSKDLETGWKAVLFNQFHDILDGCSIEPAYEDAKEFHGQALKIGLEALNNAIMKLSWSIDTMGEDSFYRSKDLDGALWEMGQKGAPFVVFNPHPFAITQPVVVPKNVVSITDWDQNPLDTQKVRAPQTNQKQKHDTLFMAQLPAFGYRTYKLYTKKEFEIPKSKKMLTADLTLENDWYRMSFDQNNGCITTLYDKVHQREVLEKNTGQLIVLDDKDSDTWAHGILSFRNEIGKFADAHVKVTEQGPVRATIRIHSRYGRSTATMDYTLYRDIPDIHVSLSINWQESRKICKISHQVNCQQPTAHYEIPFGHIQKTCNGVEEAGQRWFMAKDEKGYGLAMINDGKYSFDVLDKDMRMTLLRSTFYADHWGDHDEYNQPMDIGIHKMKYALMPMAPKTSLACVHQGADVLNQKVITVSETYHKGPLPVSQSFLNLPSGIQMHAFKQSEDDPHQYVLRCSEIQGKKIPVTIDFSLLNAKWETTFDPFEIKTFLIQPDKGVKEVNLLEW